MIVRTCLTCKHYEKNQEEGREEMRESVKIELSSSWCWHEISNGEITASDMILGGACGRDLKLWEQKERKEDEQL